MAHSPTELRRPPYVDCVDSKNDDEVINIDAYDVYNEPEPPMDEHRPLEIPDHAVLAIAPIPLFKPRLYMPSPAGREALRVHAELNTHAGPDGRGGRLSDLVRVMLTHVAERVTAARAQWRYHEEVYTREVRHRGEESKSLALIAVRTARNVAEREFVQSASVLFNILWRYDMVTALRTYHPRLAESLPTVRGRPVEGVHEFPFGTLRRALEAELAKQQKEASSHSSSPPRRRRSLSERPAVVTAASSLNDLVGLRTSRSNPSLADVTAFSTSSSRALDHIITRDTQYSRGAARAARSTDVRPPGKESDVSRIVTTTDALHSPAHSQHSQHQHHRTRAADEEEVSPLYHDPSRYGVGVDDFDA